MARKMPLALALLLVPLMLLETLLPLAYEFRLSSG
jgi:hypothetical protein